MGADGTRDLACVSASHGDVMWTLVPILVEFFVRQTGSVPVDNCVAMLYQNELKEWRIAILGWWLMFLFFLPSQ